MKILKKWYIYPIILLSLGGVVFTSVRLSQKPESDWVEVKRESIREEVDATGEVVSRRRIGMSFQKGGSVGEIKKQEGDEVAEGEAILSLDNDQAWSSVLEARASYKKAQADLDRVESGATETQIRVAEKNLRRAELDLEEKEKDLISARNEAEEDLLSAREDALSSLEDAYLKVENVLSDVDSIQRDHFTSNDQVSLQVKSAESEIERSLENLSIPDRENVDGVINDFLEELKDVSKELTTVKEATQDVSYRNLVSSSDKTTVDNHRSYINTALDNVRGARQDVSSTKINNEDSIVLVESALEDARETVELREAELEDVSNPAEDYEVEAAEAEVDRAHASLTRAQSDFSDTRITAPCAGVVAKIRPEIGESVGTEEVVSILCEGGLEVEIDIPETDIGQVTVGDGAEVSLYAFPEKEYKGQVIDIEPAETIIQGVVYYKVRVNVENIDGRSGMTAEVSIITTEKEGVLTIPRRAVYQKEGRDFVEILDGEEREVQLGISDRSARIEVASGLSEGERVILK